VTTPSKAHFRDLSWLLRYANHCRVNLDHAEPVQSIRQQFSKAAWRVLCRSDRSDFLPILQNQKLSFTDLHAYCHALAQFGWLKAPSKTLLSFVITESYLYYDQKPSAPTNQEKFIFMRLGEQAGTVTTKELALVRHWQNRLHIGLKPQMKWSRLVDRAKLWRQRERVRLPQSNGQTWHFYCRSMPWRGYEIVPLDTPLALFDEAVAMGSCLYNLRDLCSRGAQASRFFSLRRQGQRVATFELTHELPSCSSKGCELRNGRWTLQDSRLSFNRLPTAELVANLVAFATMYNIWATRPARQSQPQKSECSNKLRSSHEVRCS
jgi:hypothetical protein